MDSLTLASHLEVTVEQWFDWSKSEREIYVSKLNNMSIDDLLDRKEIPDPQGEVNDMNVTEYKELGVHLSSFLQDNYSRKCLSPSKEPQIASQCFGAHGASNSLCHSYQSPIAHFATTGATSDELYAITMEAIDHLGNYRAKRQGGGGAESPPPPPPLRPV